MLGQKDTEVKISTILGSDAECTGNFSAKGSVRLDGKVSGDVTVTGKLIIGATGSVYGNITAASVMIGGFLGCGSPDRIIDAIVNNKTSGLTIIANDTSTPEKDRGRLIVDKSNA